MAQKRMFDKSITKCDNFMEMPDSSQNLYFHLSMEADDDGFVDNWKSIMRMTGKKEDDLKLLIAKQFIIPFDSGVIVIKHWRINNFLRKDRHKDTKYLNELNSLRIEDNEEYSLKTGDEELWLTNGQPSIEENSIEENSIDKSSIDNIYDYIEKNFGRTLSPIEYEEVGTWDDNELTRYAIKQAVLNSKYNIRYIAVVLNNYKKSSITTVVQAQQEEERFKQQTSKTSGYKEKYKEPIPDWLGKEIESEPASDEQVAIFEKYLRGEVLTPSEERELNIMRRMGNK